LQQVAQGNRSALDELLARHRGELRAFIELHMDRALRGRVDPSDVVQESLMIVTRRLPEFLAGRPVPFHLWARQFAYQRLKNTHRDNRAARRDVKREVAGPDRSSIALANSIVCPGPSPSDGASMRELTERATAAVETLPEADREILLLRLTESLPFDEIGVLLEIKPATARQRFGRALRRLDKALVRQGIEGSSP
jgi:RNA polymerase sigma-70 factor (ECF subfamily)